MTSLAQQTLAKLKALKLRWYAAKESVGIDILHALQGEEGDDFGGLFAMVELLQASERERERLAKALDQLNADADNLAYRVAQNLARAEAAEAKLASLERGGKEDQGSVAGCADAQSALPRGRLAGSATPSGGE